MPSGFRATQRYGGSREIGLLLCVLRQAILDGEVTPSWPVNRNGMRNDIMAIELAAKDLKRGVTMADREMYESVTGKPIMARRELRKQAGLARELVRLQEQHDQVVQKRRQVLAELDQAEGTTLKLLHDARRQTQAELEKEETETMELLREVRGQVLAQFDEEETAMLDMLRDVRGRFVARGGMPDEVL